MAGIGFKLQQIISDKSYTSVLKGFAYALILSSGPWLIIVASLGTLSIYSTFFITLQSRQLFKILLVNNYFITIIITGTFQLFFTRIFADKLYDKQRKDLSNIIMCNLLVVLLFLTAVIIPFLLLIDAPFVIKLLTFSFFIATAISWVLLSYASASDDFLKFIKHYLIGAGASLLLGYVLGNLFDFIGLYIGFILGQVYIAIMLFLKTVRIFGFPEQLSFEYITKKLYYRDLLASGFFLYAGMWVDKLIFWYGPTGIHYNSILYYNLHYDDVFYIAFLLATPLIAIFFLTIETSFYKHYYIFYNSLIQKGQHGNLEKIKKSCNKLIACIDSSLWLILTVQGIITVGGILFSKNIIRLFNMPEEIDLLLNVVLVGRFFQMMMMLICVLLLYFDLRKETIKVFGLFFVLNTFFTLLFLQLGEQFSGFGLTSAAIIGFIYALHQLKYFLRHAIYYTFTKKELPYAKSREKRIYINKTGCFGRYYVKNGKKLIEP